MNIQTLQPARPLATLTAGGASTGQPVEALSPVAALAALVAASQPQSQQQAGSLRRPLAAAQQPFFEPGIQQEIAAAQQGQAWLQDTGRKLQGLKQSLAGLLSGMPQPAAEGQLRQVQQAWARRSSGAGGMVDAQMRITAPGQARQGFTIRGLDLNALVDEGPETLSFAVPGSAQAVSVAIDPGEAPETQVLRLDQGLAPVGVRASMAGGALRFDTSEDQWPALRDGLAIKGGGRRFPSGQRVRVRLEPEAQAVQPGSWSLESGAAQRQTLARVLAAQGLLDKASATLREQTAALSLPEAADAAARATELLAFAQDFQAKAGEGGYEHIAQLPPALKG